MLPFSAFDPAAITVEVNTLPRCHDFGSSISFSLLQSKNNVTTLCSTGSQQGIDVADTVNVDDRRYANIERA